MTRLRRSVGKPGISSRWRSRGRDTRSGHLYPTARLLSIVGGAIQHGRQKHRGLAITASQRRVAVPLMRSLYSRPVSSLPRAVDHHKSRNARCRDRRVVRLLQHSVDERSATVPRAQSRSPDPGWMPAHPGRPGLEPLGAHPALSRLAAPADLAGGTPRRRQRLDRRDARAARRASPGGSASGSAPAENLGFVRGNNAGIAAAPAGSDVVLLNNDVEFRRRDWLKRLPQCAHSAPDVGVVGCRLVLPDGRLLHAGTYILPDTMWGQQIGALETDVGQYAAAARSRGSSSRAPT